MVNEKTWELIYEIEQGCFDVWGAKGRLEFERKSRSYCLAIYVRDQCKMVMRGVDFNHMLESIIDHLKGESWASQIK